MKLNELSPSEGQSKNRKRVGRGVASGTGTTAGRGHKGYNCRSGGGVRAGFEGGQMPIYRRLPKRGFTNIFKKHYQIVNVCDLERFKSGDIVDKNALIKVGLIKDSKTRVKLLGNGDIHKSLKIKIDKISGGAKMKIESAGGKIEGIF